MAPLKRPRLAPASRYRLRVNLETAPKPRAFPPRLSIGLRSRNDALKRSGNMALLSATRKRHAHALANQAATNVQNATADSVQNEKSGNSKSA
jgi:hypothetical protein